MANPISDRLTRWCAALFLEQTKVSLLQTEILYRMKGVSLPESDPPSPHTTLQVNYGSTPWGVKCQRSILD